MSTTDLSVLKHYHEMYPKEVHLSLAMVLLYVGVAAGCFIYWGTSFLMTGQTVAQSTDRKKRARQLSAVARKQGNVTHAPMRESAIQMAICAAKLLSSQIQQISGSMWRFCLRALIYNFSGFDAGFCYKSHNAQAATIVVVLCVSAVSVVLVRLLGRCIIFRLKLAVRRVSASIPQKKKPSVDGPACLTHTHATPAVSGTPSTGSASLALLPTPPPSQTPSPGASHLGPDAAPESAMVDNCLSAASDHDQTPNKLAPGSAADAAPHDAAHALGDAVPASAASASGAATPRKPEADSSGPSSVSLPHPPTLPTSSGPSAAPMPTRPNLPTAVAASSGPSAASHPHPDSLPSPAASPSDLFVNPPPQPSRQHSGARPVSRGCGRVCKPKAWLEKTVARQQRTIRQQRSQLSRRQKLAADVEAAEAALQQAKIVILSNAVVHALMVSAQGRTDRATVDQLASIIAQLAEQVQVSAGCLLTAGGCMQMQQQQLAEAASRNLKQAEQLADTTEQLAESASSNQQQAEQLRIYQASIKVLEQQLAASASSNQRHAEESHSIVQGKDRCLRTSEAFVEALQQRLADERQQLVESKSRLAGVIKTCQTLQNHYASCEKERRCAEEKAEKLRSQLQPLQEEHDMVHHVFNAAGLPQLPSQPPQSLGSGTFGHVDGCYSPALGAYVVKSPTARSSPDDLDREARNLLMFRHPNVVQYFGRDSTSAAAPGIVLERLSVDLSKYLDRFPRSRTVVNVLSIGVQLAAGLNHLHAQGHVHGDLKPNNVGINVFTRPVPTAKLLDLGQVKKEGLYTYRRTLPFVQDYCPPEIADRFHPHSRNTYHLTKAAEVFNFGLILAEVAGASRLYPKERHDYMSQLTHLSYDSWGKFPANHGYPVEFVDLVKRCLNKDPRQRPTMAHVVRRLGILNRS